MPDDYSNIVIMALFIGIGVLAMVSILVKLAKNRYAPMKVVKAVVVDKNKVKNFSKYSRPNMIEKYVIVFSVDGKKKSFYVSQFSYNGYKINEKGTLKYKGDRLIEFK